MRTNKTFGWKVKVIGAWTMDIWYATLIKLKGNWKYLVLLLHICLGCFRQIELHSVMLYIGELLCTLHSICVIKESYSVLGTI